MADTMKNEFAADADRFVDDLRAGTSIAAALEAANDVAHHPAVIEAGIAMFAEHGSIDMKQLAADAGMSRASLYRYYPDKVKVEAEIAGVCLEGMADAARLHHTPATRFRAAAQYLLEHPGEAAAVVPFAAMVSVSVLGPTVEKVTGDAGSAPMIVGIAVMAATPGRQVGDEAAIRDAIEQCAALLD